MKLYKLFYFAKIMIYIIGWVILAPLSCIYPRKKRIVFFGGCTGTFTTNVKYLFSYAWRKGLPNGEIFIITEDAIVFNTLKRMKLPVLKYPSMAAVRILLSSKIAIFDHMEWIANAKFFLLFRSVKVQLWHGVGFKRIELLNLRSKIFIKKNLLLRYYIMAYRLLRGRYPKYNVVVSTSLFYTQNVFSKAFYSSFFLDSGYPRNDILINQKTYDFNSKRLETLFTDSETIHKALTQKKIGKKIIIFAPTFRDSKNNIYKSEAWNFERWDHFNRKNQIILIIKDHPRPDLERYAKQSDTIFYYNNSCDIYPFLPSSDLLITDYSSIYMDYLLLDKPIVFYPFDYEYYISNDREIQFDYNWITPGPKCFSQEDLEIEILNFLFLGKDLYAEKRNEIKKIAFKFHDGRSSERIWNFIISKYMS